MREFEEIKKHLKLKTDEREGVFFYLPQASEFKKQEIIFHDAIHQAEEEVHQLNSLRNVYYHDYFKKYLNNLSKDSIILELGAGSGYDSLPLVKSGHQLIISDISPKSVLGVKARLASSYPELAEQPIYLVADGQHLPLPDQAVEAVFMVACLHHFENQATALDELTRVVKPGGQIICAMEPSKFMMSFTKLFSRSKSLRIHQGHSEADETHPGYNKSAWQRLTINKPLAITKLKRVWLAQGFLHYGLEALFRIFKLKKRLKIPRWLEWALWLVDEILLTIPFINQLNWHWLVVISRI